MLRVVRVGGSLLTWKQFRPAFDKWMSSLPPARSILVAGGGPWVELLRQATKRFDLDEQAAHWNCVRAMSVTAELLGNVLRIRRLTRFDELDTLAPNETVAFDVFSFLSSKDSHCPEPLPQGWHVTSDSIAARVAVAARADEVVLLKSQAPPSDDVQELANADYVDDWFPRASSGIGVSFVNLRSFA